MLCLCNYTNSFRKYKRRAVFSKSLFVSQASFHAYFRPVPGCCQAVLPRKPSDGGRASGHRTSRHHHRCLYHRSCGCYPSVSSPPASPQFLAARLCVSRQFAEVHDRALADLAIRIAPVIRETVVVILLYRPVWPLPVFRYPANEHDCKGSDFLTNHQTPGGPTGGGKRNECLSLLAIFSKKGDYKGTWRMKTYGF